MATTDAMTSSRAFRCRRKPTESGICKSSSRRQAERFLSAHGIIYGRLLALRVPGEGVVDDGQNDYSRDATHVSSAMCQADRCWKLLRVNRAGFAGGSDP